VTEQMLATGVAPSARDDFGCTPLHAAVRANQHEAVAALLSHGADPAVADAYGNTAIALARREGLPTIVALLEQSSETTSPPIEQSAGGH
jgi:ankyrin repeat protein